MPAKNILKLYIENGYYHIYNRGVEKRTIFQDEQDYKVFLSYLKLYLNPIEQLGERTVTLKNVSFIAPQKPVNNFHNEVDLLVYCLMPNHFHLLVKQRSARSIELFMKSLLTKYVIYFNKRHNRVGGLFQDTYKAVLVENETYLLHLSRYIHLNPAPHVNHVKDTPLYDNYSSYADYLGLRETSWIKKDLILSFFKNTQKTHLRDILSYQSFVEDYREDTTSTLNDLTLDQE
ncbi:MAG: transposase [Candidatus Levybacteria bacterium]|nr:transposase [Candidatus Levybacteria bacterium]